MAKSDQAVRAERARGDRAIAAAAELGNALDLIERNLLSMTRYKSENELRLDVLDLIRVGRENASACYGGVLPQLATAMQEIRRLNDEVARLAKEADRG